MTGTSSPGESMTPDELRAVMLALLEEDEGVFGAAVSEHGVLVPMPDTLRCAHPVPFVTDRVLDTFVPEDWPELARQWLAVKTEGAAVLTVHLAERPAIPIELLLGDFRFEHGVILAVLRTSELSVADVHALTPPSTPRMCVLHRDANNVIVDVDAAATAMLGWERHELVGRGGSETVHPADITLMHQGYISATRGDEQPRRVRVRRRRKDGSWLWVETIHVDHLDDPDRYVSVVLVDISEEMAAITALQEREMLLSSLTQALPEGLLQVDRQGRVVFTNPQLHTILQSPPDADLPGVLAAVAPEDRMALAGAITAALGGGGDTDLELDLVASVGDGSDGTGCRRRCQVHVRALCTSSGLASGALVCVSDVTEAAQLRRALEQRALELEDRATYDGLTRCHNRATVMAVLERALDRGHGTDVAVVFVDIDGFKPINDRFGHAAGDELLGTVAARLRGALRGDDVVGRIGGDEFLLVCHDVSGPTDALAVGQRIGAALAHDVVIDGTATRVCSSLGVARADGTVGAEELVRRADLAMYRSKRGGRGDPVVYEASLEPGAEPPGPGLPQPLAG